ncbi:MAG TPA: hypothetical protein VNG71_19450 [Pyrinomonadaceae bacterium]|nr:hypothetical protein [Pyrinomonadaceae bacterium]
MHQANFCAECGERLTFTGWRGLLRRSLCGHCARRLGGWAAYRPLIILALVTAAAFGFGRYLRPSPPPLIIQRAANSPLFGTSNQQPVAQSNRAQSNQLAPVSNDEVYICGARTKKGTPCKRRVHAAGERCFQHKGMPAMVALEKLTIKPN